MLRKNITYTDYNGVTRSEDFYFNLSKAELMEMELGTSGGYAEMIQQIIDAKDAPSIMKICKDIIMKAYGERSADGKRFMKVDRDGYPLVNDFIQTEAYSILFTEFATDADFAASFINGIMPQDLVQSANLAAKNL